MTNKWWVAGNAGCIQRHVRNAGYVLETLGMMSFRLINQYRIVPD